MLLCGVQVAVGLKPNVALWDGGGVEVGLKPNATLWDGGGGV